jgi:hypothetical protein
MSVQTGIAPQQLLALDGDMFDALATAADERWPLELELQATTVELLHAQLLAFLRVYTKQGTKLPDPVSYPRPQAAQQDDERRVQRISVAELARMPGLTAELQEAK